MKKRLIKLIAFVLVLTFALAPVTANADTRLGTAAVSTGTNLAVLPVTENPNLIPILNITATLPQDQFIVELERRFGVYQRVTTVSGHYRSLHDSGVYTKWNFGDCVFNGNAGRASVTFYYPISWDEGYADEIPWYEISFSASNDGSFGTHLWFTAMADRRFHLESYGLVGEGPDGISYIFNSWNREMEITVARPMDRTDIGNNSGYMPLGNRNLSGAFIYI